MTTRVTYFIAQRGLTHSTCFWLHSTNSVENSQRRAEASNVNTDCIFSTNQRLRRLYSFYVALAHLTLVSLLDSCTMCIPLTGVRYIITVVINEVHFQCFTESVSQREMSKSTSHVEMSSSISLYFKAVKIAHFESALKIFIENPRSSTFCSTKCILSENLVFFWCCIPLRSGSIY